MPSDAELIEALASALYDHSIAGLTHSEAAPWLATPPETREHWRDLARVARQLLTDAHWRPA